jgi:tellurite resistance protein TerC
LIQQFHWTIYIFGVFLLFTGLKMITQKDKKIEPDNNPVIKLSRKIFRVTGELYDDKFFVKIDKKKFVTPLFLVLILIEVIDLIFAVDSIPAILAITQDQFIVYTSNVFAILGLRSLYFALAHIIHRFIYLSYGLAVILMFVGLKMILVDIYKIPTFLSLIIIAIILAISIAASIAKTKDTNR